MSKGASSVVTIPSRAQTWPANLDSQRVPRNPPRPPPPPTSSPAAGTAKTASVRDAPDDDDGQIVNDDDEKSELVTDPNDPKIFRDGRAPRSTDVFIAVMGVTGCGKSSFISLCCNKPVQIGHDLKSCTAVVDVYPFELSPTQTVYLIDTPGFDDTAKNDTEVLREIASWLTESFKSKILLHGIIYLHRISDVRMQGSAKKNLLMFKKLCGDDALRKVILATTMWDIVPSAVAQAREKELVDTPEFWGYMVSKGSRLWRHDKTLARAREIVRSLITGGDRSRPTIVLDLQDQMVTQARPLQETAAGIELEAELARERKRWEKELKEAREMMKEAIAMRDSESEKAMRELRDDYTNKIEKLKSEHKKLRTDTEQLHTERFLRFKKAMREQDKAKRSEGHEERQVGWTGAPYFAYSIVGSHSYSLAGPWSQWGNCMSDRSFEKMKAINGGRCVLMWCGVGGAWVQKFQTGHMTWMTRFNKKLALYYPDLREKLRRLGGAWDTEWPEWICLGPSKRYILQWDMKLPTTGSGEAAQPGAAVLTRHRMDWCLPDPAADALQKARKGGRLRAAALGVKGAYIFVPETGPAVWDLAGSYANLKRFLENQSTDIEAVALNPLNDDFILHYRNGYVFASLERSCLTIQELDAWSLKNQ